MNYCPHCGAAVVFRTPPGDTLPRHVCTRCETIHYQNPKVVVGSIVEWEGNILLCRRAIEPRRGFWTLPAGYMELGETTEDGAKREACQTLDQLNSEFPKPPGSIASQAAQARQRAGCR